MRYILTVLAVLTVGCPGQSRPPPMAAPAAPIPEPKSDPERPGVAEPDLSGFESTVDALESLVAAFSGDAQTWTRLMERVDDAQTVSYQLQESVSEEDTDALYVALEKLQLVRDDLVRRQAK